MQDALAVPQASAHQVDTHNQKLPSKVELLATQSSIARSMEARIEGMEALLSLKMDIEMEKRKVAKIAKLERAKDLGAISDAEFKSQVRAILGFELDGAPI